MQKLSRRSFIKITSALGATGIVGNYFLNKAAGPVKGGIIKTGPDTGMVKGVPVVSDVDGHSQCRMRVHLENEKITIVLGDSTDPEGKGELTLRGKHIKEFLYSPDRLTHPLKRAGKRGEGKWKKISWDEALTTISRQFNTIKETYGAEAIDFHHGHYHSGDILGTYLPRLANLIGTPNITNPSHVCHLPRVFLQFNIDFGAVYQPDLSCTKCLVLWGGNPLATNKPQAIAIKEAMARGIKLIVIDPRKIEYAKKADIHAQLRPGTDGALALGMLHVLTRLAKDHELPEKLLRYRTLGKLKSTYIDALQKLADKETGRVHTSFNQAITVTGRLSSSNPNLHNIPIRKKEGKKIRKAFIPKENHTLISADYSQIELRILAHCANDEILIEAFKNGEDIHIRTALEVFQVLPQFVTNDLRNQAKTINFGIIYGMSGFRLANDLNISRKMANAYIDNYFKRYSGVKKFIDATIEETKKTCEVYTIFGRKRRLDDINSSNINVRNFAQRAAVNTPIQGSAADLIKLAMIKSYLKPRLRKKTD